MKALKILIGILAVLGLLVLVVYFITPADGHMERSIEVNASPEKVYGTLNTFETFNDWSPWAAIDPTTQYVFEGPSEGVGSKMSWTSDDPNVGNGMQEIIESVPHSKIVTKMEFEGFGGNTTASFLIEPSGDGSSVTWTYDAKDQSGMARFFNLGIDSFLGPFYEDGLKQLKNFVESMPDEEPVQLPEMPVESDTTSVQ